MAVAVQQAVTGRQSLVRRRPRAQLVRFLDIGGMHKTNKPALFDFVAAAPGDPFERTRCEHDASARRIKQDRVGSLFRHQPVAAFRADARGFGDDFLGHIVTDAKHGHDLPIVVELHLAMGIDDLHRDRRVFGMGAIIER